MTEELESREPSVEDLVDLCRHLNAAGARYVVVGGFAVRAAGYDRRTMDIRDKDLPDVRFLRLLLERSGQMDPE